MATNAKDVAKTLDSIGTVSFASDADRYEALEAARRLVARLTTPFEHYITLSGSIPSLVAGIQVFQDLKIWSIWRGKFQEHGNVSQTLSDIVTMCDVPVEPSLIRKLGFLDDMITVTLFDALMKSQVVLRDTLLHCMSWRKLASTNGNRRR